MENDKIAETSDSDVSNNEIHDKNEIEWVEEESESEPEYECDIWDDDCVVVHHQQRKNAICGYHLMPTCPLEHEVPPLKRQKVIGTPKLNNNLIEKSFMEVFTNNWRSLEEFSTKSVEFVSQPFKVCIIDDFLSDDAILSKIREDFYEISWNKRNMDLYELFQSNNVVTLKEKYVSCVYEFLETDVLNWIQQLTGYEFYKISATCSCYTDTDYLLIHDDLQEDRLVAFILYITDPAPGSDKDLWTEQMGGLLELFNKDEKGHPVQAVKRILPKNNRFVFFETTNDSYHQVSEVLSMDYCRLSINGWFHSKNCKTYKTPAFETPKNGLFTPVGLPPLNINFPLSNWIKSQYLQDNIKKQIQYHVENDSEISLNNFFKEEKLEELCQVLQNDDIIWDKVGPPNRRNYEVISTIVTPKIITEFLSLFQSKTMFALLHEYTDLDLNSDLKSNIKPTVKMELQRWKPGNYSLFSEHFLEAENELDLIMYFGIPEQLNIVGGQVMYLSMSEKVEDALVTLQPKSNDLNIVFRDTARIVKYVSRRSTNEYFYMIVCSYKE